MRKSISMSASTGCTSLVNKAPFSSLDSAIVRFLHRWKVWRHRQEVLDDSSGTVQAYSIQSSCSPEIQRGTRQRRSLNGSEAPMTTDPISSVQDNEQSRERERLPGPEFFSSFIPAPFLYT